MLFHNVNLTLHSTMSLLKPAPDTPNAITHPSLHSTMSLLKPQRKGSVCD